MVPFTISFGLILKNENFSQFVRNWRDYEEKYQLSSDTYWSCSIYHKTVNINEIVQFVINVYNKGIIRSIGKDKKDKLF